jgi:hypothetical protein
MPISAQATPYPAMLAYSLSTYASLLRGQLISSGIHAEAKFQVLLFFFGGWGEIETKAKLIPAGAGAGAWAKLVNKQ